MPGFAFASAINSFTDFASTPGYSTSTYGAAEATVIGAKSRIGSYGSLMAKPGTLNYASGGIGSAQHLATELFALMAGIKVVHVPFKGAVSVPDVIAGRVEILFSGVPQGLPHIQAGRLRALGVTTLKRSAAVPNVPTIAESGVPGYDVTIWYGIFATGRTPRPILDKINAGFVQAIQSPDVRQQLTAMGLDPVGNPSAQFAAAIKEEIARWEKVARNAGIGRQ